MCVGQKVVCVDDVFHPAVAKFYLALPKKDVVYVIRRVSIGISAQGDPGEVCLHLIGLNNPKSSKSPFPERGFNAERFRLLDEKEEFGTKSLSESFS
jgi:hypothetical protein